MSDVFVYIAGPYSSDPEGNAEEAIVVGEIVFCLGYIPYIPHLAHWWHERYQHKYEEWMRLGTAWAEKCDVILRLPGKSLGADEEEKLGVPVVYSVAELMEKFPVEKHDA